MKLVKPITYTEPMLISSNATETYTAWAAGTTYALNAYAIYSNVLYQSLQASNLGKQPDTNPTWWQVVSADNKHSMFDAYINTQTTANASLVVKIAPGTRLNTLGFLNMSGATTLVISATDGAAGPVIYSKSISLDSTVIIDWYGYFFEPYRLASEVILQDFPPYSNPYIQMTLSAASGTVGIGHWVFGTGYFIGNTQSGASASVRDFSTKEADTYGNVVFTKRAFSKRMSASTFVPNTNLTYIQKLLADVRATPTLWIGTDYTDYTPLNIFGYYKDFSIEISYPTVSLCKLEIEGLI